MKVYFFLFPPVTLRAHPLHSSKHILLIKNKKLTFAIQKVEQALKIPPLAATPPAARAPPLAATPPVARAPPLAATPAFLQQNGAPSEQVRVARNSEGVELLESFVNG